MRLLEPLLLAQRLVLRRLVRGRLFAFGQENLVGPPDQVLQAVGEAGAALAHLVPDAAERVVGQELDDVARREELVAHGELAAVARGRGFGAHLAALVLAVEVLVDPADGLVLLPDRGELGVVQDREEIGERLAPGPEQARGIAPVEEHADLAAELVEQALEVEPVAVVGQVGKAGREARRAR